MSDANAKSSLEICIMSTYVDEKGELQAKSENAKRFNADFTSEMEIPVGNYTIKKEQNGKELKYLDNGLVYSKNSNGKYVKKAKIKNAETRDNN